jgi:hypothetical protein
MSLGDRNNVITKVRHLTRMNVNALNEIGVAQTVGWVPSPKEDEQ